MVSGSSRAWILNQAEMFNAICNNDQNCKIPALKLISYNVQSFEPERHFIVFFINMLLFHNFDHSQFIVCNIDRWRECIYTSLSCLGSMRGSVSFNLVTNTDTSQCCWICSAAYFVHLFISAPPLPSQEAHTVHTILASHSESCERWSLYCL